MYSVRDQETQPLAARSLTHQYDLNIAVLGDLGFSDREIETGAPSLESIEAGLSDLDREWINGQAGQGYMARLTIAPSVQVIGLEGGRNEPGLVPRFDAKQSFVKKGGSVVSKAWRSIGDKHPLHDNGFNEEFSAAILLLPIGMPRLVGGEADETTSGQALHSVDSVANKMKLLERQRLEQAQAGRRVISAPISHLIVSEAQDRHAGERSFHYRLSSCQVHYPPLSGHRSDTRPTLGRGGRYNQRLELHARMLFVANEAVLRAVHIPTDTAKD